MVTTKLIEKLKATIVATMKLPMLKRVSAAQSCVVDSVVVIEHLSSDVIALNERVKALEENATTVRGILNSHIKRGH